MYVVLKRGFKSPFWQNDAKPPLEGAIRRSNGNGEEQKVWIHKSPLEIKENGFGFAVCLGDVLPNGNGSYFVVFDFDGFETIDSCNETIANHVGDKDFSFPATVITDTPRGFHFYFKTDSGDLRTNHQNIFKGEEMKVDFLGRGQTVGPEQALYKLNDDGGRIKLGDGSYSEKFYKRIGPKNARIAILPDVLLNLVHQQSNTSKRVDLSNIKPSGTSDAIGQTLFLQYLAEKGPLFKLSENFGDCLLYEICCKASELGIVALLAKSLIFPFWQETPFYKRNTHKITFAESYLLKKLHNAYKYGQKSSELKVLNLISAVSEADIPNPIIADCLYSGAKHLFYAEDGVGKTFWGIHCSLYLSTGYGKGFGESFFDASKLLFINERSMGTTASRIATWKDYHVESKDHKRFDQMCEENFMCMGVYEESTPNSVLNWLTSNKCKVLYIDSLLTLASQWGLVVEESVGANELMNFLDAVTKEGITVIAMGHTTKSNGKVDNETMGSYFGSSQIANRFEVMGRLRQNLDDLACLQSLDLIITKCNYGRKGGKFVAPIYYNKEHNNLCVESLTRSGYGLDMETKANEDPDEQ